MDSTEINLQKDYDKVFPSRLRRLMDDTHISQQKLADYLGLKNRQSVAGYCNGRSTPDLESVVKIASFFSVSTDYLLGATDDPSPAPSAVDDLGLSPKAVQYLRTLHELTKTPDPTFEGSADYIACADALKAHGFAISPPDIQANALFSEQITNLLRTVLDERAEHTGG